MAKNKGDKTQKAAMAGAAVGGGGALVVVLALHFSGGPAQEAAPPPEPAEPAVTDVLPEPEPDPEPAPEPEPAGLQAIATHSEGHAMAPTFSADGNTLAYEVHGRANMRSVYVVPIGTDEVPEPVAVTPREAPWPAYDVAEPLWVNEMLLVELWQRGARSSRLFAAPMGLDGEELMPREIAPPSLTEVAVSPDGKTLAWVSERDLWVWWRDSTAPPVQLTKSKEQEHCPQFSPNGRQLLFSRGDMGSRDLLLLSVPPAPTEDEPLVQEPMEPTPIATEIADETQGTPLADGHYAYLESPGPGIPFSITEKHGLEREVLARDVVAPISGPVSMSPDRQYLLWVTNAHPDTIVLYRVRDGAQFELETDVVQAEAPAMGVRGTRRWVAYSGIPKEEAGKYKRLFADDITEALSQ